MTVSAVKKGFSFISLPYLVQYSIYEKFTYEKFANFEECSQISLEICDLHRNRKFPLKALSMEIWADKNMFFLHLQNEDIVNTICDKLYKNVNFQSEFLLVMRQPTQVVCQFLKEAVNGVKFLKLINIYKITPEISTLLKGMGLKRLFIKPLQVDESMLDHGYIDDVCIQAPLTIDQMFSINAKKTASVFFGESFQESMKPRTNQIIEKLQKWKAGRFSFNCNLEIIMTYRQGISFDISFTAYGFQKVTSKNRHCYAKWRIVKDTDPKKLLILRLKQSKEDCDQTVFTIEQVQK